MAGVWGYNTADYYANGTWEPQRQNHFELIIKGLDPKSLGLEGLGTDIENIGGAVTAVASQMMTTIVKLAVTNVSLPDVSIESKKLPKAGNRKEAIATGYSFGDLSITFRDDCKQDIDRLLYSWCQAVVNPMSGKYGAKKNYKKDACLAKFSPDGSISRFWVLKGIFPTRYAQSSFDVSGGSNIATIDMTCNVDLAYPSNAVDITKEGFLASMFF